MIICKILILIIYIQIYDSSKGYYFQLPIIFFSGNDEGAKKNIDWRDILGHQKRITYYQW